MKIKKIAFFVYRRKEFEVSWNCTLKKTNWRKKQKGKEK
jgi:hypothetical protein